METPTFRERKGRSLVMDSTPVTPRVATDGQQLDSGLGLPPRPSHSVLPQLGASSKGSPELASVTERVLSSQTASASGADSSQPRQGGLGWLSSPIAAELIYCTMSAGTTLFNKHALSSYNFPAPNSLLFFQFALAVLLLQGLDALGIIWLQPLRMEMVRVWLPVNLIFVAMNVTGFYALQDVGVGMFTVLKNLSNLMTIAGDYIFFGYTYSWQVWGCLGLMILSALLGGWTDAQFSLRGYAWQLINCLFTAAYSLYLSGVIRKLSRQQHGKQQLTEMSMVYYNNLLSVPPLALISLLSGDPARLRHAPQLADTSFQIVSVVGGILGFGVSFASIWCMSRTSATIYSLTGSMNKVVVALCGMWYFDEKSSLANMSSIAAGLAAGFLFVFAKSSGPSMKEANNKEAASTGDEEQQLLGTTRTGTVSAQDASVVVVGHAQLSPHLSTQQTGPNSKRAL